MSWRRILQPQSTISLYDEFPMSIATLGQFLDSNRLVTFRGLNTAEIASLSSPWLQESHDIRSGFSILPKPQHPKLEVL